MNKSSAIHIPNAGKLVEALFPFLDLIILTDHRQELLHWGFSWGAQKSSEFSERFEILFWNATLRIGKLNKILKEQFSKEELLIDPETLKLKLVQFSKMLKDLWWYFCMIFLKVGLTPEDIEGIYLGIWQSKFREAKTAMAERELAFQKLAFIAPKNEVQRFFKADPHFWEKEKE